jgi:hypothetical protein
MSFTVTVTSVSGSTPLAMTWIGIYNTYSNIGVPTVTAELQYTYNYAAGCNQFQELVSLYQATKQYANTIKLSPAASIPLPAPPSYYRAVNTDSNTQKLSSLINLWTQANGWSNYENIQNFCTPPWFGLQCNSAGNVTVISLGNNNLVCLCFSFLILLLCFDVLEIQCCVSCSGSQYDTLDGTNWRRFVDFIAAVLTGQQSVIGQYSGYVGSNMDAAANISAQQQLVHWIDSAHTGCKLGLEYSHFQSGAKPIQRLVGGSVWLNVAEYSNHFAQQ